MAAIETSHDLDTALDYLPVAARAAHRNPSSDTLWFEAYHAQRAIIDYADTHLPEPLAADVQVTVGRIARQAVCPFSTNGTGNAAYLTESDKTRIRTFLNR